LHSSLSLLAIIVLIGWALEGPGTYWSKDEACITWLGGPPVLAMMVALLWRKATTVEVLMTFVWSAGAFSAGLVARGHRMNDDALGLSVAVGAVAVAGFVLGRIIRRRWIRARVRSLLDANA
jgi:hypothetical protein